MRLEKIQRTSPGLVTSKGHYLNSKGKATHHPKDSETPIDFIGIDGEGMTVNGKHRYVLFGIGEDQIEDPDGLRWSDVFEFLYQRYRTRTAFTGFYLGYDFTQIISTMPENKAWMLLTTEGRTLRKHRIKGKAPHPVEYDGWQFDMLAMKRLRIRPKTCDCPTPTCKCKHSPWLYVCDVGSFFQSSFLTVIDPINWVPGTEVVTSDEFQLVKKGKEKRSVAILDDDMRKYNALENIILARVMRTMDQGFHDIGIHLPPSKWFGPGQAAQAWLKNEKVPTGEEIREVVPDWFMEAARMSYFGGWFEQMIHGIIPGETHEYDINSAYPSVIETLPCLLHGTYSHGVGNPTDVESGDLCLVYANVWAPIFPDSRKGQYIGTMLHREPDGSILRPNGTEGWYWYDELRAAQACGLLKKFTTKGYSKIQRWVNYKPCDCPPPMRKIAGLYDKRLAVGKNTPLGKAAKLAYNSAYGKFAQSVGDPIFGNPVYASRITSGCRTIILNAIRTHPDGKKAVSMVATDAVYFLSPHPTLPISSKLGEWDHTVKRNLTQFKPGVYWDDKARDLIAKGESPHFKARGFKASDFTEQLTRVDAEYRSWDNGGMPKPNKLGILRGWPEVTFKPTFAMVTALQALRRSKWELAGTVTTEKDAIEMRQNSDPQDKRYTLYRDTYQGRTIYRSEPEAGMRLWGGEYVWTPSTPYEKRFGMDDPWSDEVKETYGINQDGYVIDIVSWMIARHELT